MTKNRGLFPKIEPLRGSLHQEWRRCGKPTCRCAKQGPEQRLHGPYYRRRWWENGQQRRQYVRPGDVATVEAGIEEWHKLHPPVWWCHQMFRQLIRLANEEFGR